MRKEFRQIIKGWSKDKSREELDDRLLKLRDWVSSQRNGIQAMDSTEKDAIRVLLDRKPRVGFFGAS